MFDLICTISLHEETETPDLYIKKNIRNINVKVLVHVLFCNINGSSFDFSDKPI